MQLISIKNRPAMSKNKEEQIQPIQMDIFETDAFKKEFDTYLATT